MQASHTLTGAGTSPRHTLTGRRTTPSQAGESPCHTLTGGGTAHSLDTGSKLHSNTRAPGGGKTRHVHKMKGSHNEVNLRLQFITKMKCLFRHSRIVVVEEEAEIVRAMAGQLSQKETDQVCIHVR